MLGTHILGFLHIQEAARRWAGRQVMIAVSCVGTTRTKAMTDPAMPFIMRLMARFGTSPEISAANSVRLLAAASARETNGAVLQKPARYSPQPLALDLADANKLWGLTGRICQAHGLKLP